MITAYKTLNLSISDPKKRNASDDAINVRTADGWSVHSAYPLGEHSVFVLLEKVFETAEESIRARMDVREQEE